jgi:hypothetical protein
LQIGSLASLLVVTKLLLVACEQMLYTSNWADSLTLACFVLGSLALTKFAKVQAIL